MTLYQPKTFGGNLAVVRRRNTLKEWVWKGCLHLAALWAHKSPPKITKWTRNTGSVKPHKCTLLSSLPIDHFLFLCFKTPQLWPFAQLRQHRGKQRKSRMTFTIHPHLSLREPKVPQRPVGSPRLIRSDRPGPVLSGPLSKTQCCPWVSPFWYYLRYSTLNFWIFVKSAFQGNRFWKCLHLLFRDPDPTSEWYSILNSD